MTRKRMTATIKEALEEQGIELTPEEEAICEVAINGTLDYIQSFAQDTSRELVGVGLYTEAMVAGVIVRKIKKLRTGIE